MELATFEKDFWQLRSAEQSHNQHPDTFWIPEENERKSLCIGDAARLIFEIEFINELNELQVRGERMNVIVSEILEDGYIGLLDSQPVTIEPNDDFYLCFGAEIPFTAEHVIDIDRPPDEYIEWQLNQAPERIWDRR